MRFATFEVPTSFGPARRFGVVQDDGFMLDANIAYRTLVDRTGDCTRAEPIADALVPADLLAYLQGGTTSKRALDDAIEFAASTPTDSAPAGMFWKADDVRFCAPLPRPSSLREFGQYEKHMTRGGKKELPPVWYEMPVYWKGNHASFIGPEEVIPWPSFCNRMDVELEIAAVISRPGINISPEDATDYIAGFTIFNDVSARDQQHREMAKGTGPCKGKDFCNILGPVLVTPDEIDVTNLNVGLRINGEQWASSSTSAMYRTWGELIAHVSRDEWLHAGDVLVSGTVDGCCALEYYDWPAEGDLLHPGDAVELEVEGIGVLCNTIGHPAAR